MVRIWIDTANERQRATRLNTPRADAAWLPDPPGQSLPWIRRAQRIIRLILALTIIGMVIPSDLYLANWFFGDPIHAFRDPMVINSLINLTVALAVPMIPLALLALLLHIRCAAIMRRQESAD